MLCAKYGTVSICLAVATLHQYDCSTGDLTKLKAHRVEVANFREPIADTAKAVNKLIKLLSYPRGDGASRWPRRNGDSRPRDRFEKGISSAGTKCTGLVFGRASSRTPLQVPEYGRRTSPRKASQDSHQVVGMNLFQIMGDRSAVCWRRQSCNCKELDWADSLACEWEFTGVKDGENHASEDERVRLGMDTERRV